MANNALVFSKSPLDILGIYLSILRHRFSFNVPDDFPWVWTEDPTTTKIFIEIGAGDEVQLKDVRPALYVDRSPFIFPKVVLGDYAGEHRTSGYKAFYSTATGQINIDLVSKNRGESAILAEIVQSFILMTADLILSKYSFRDITPVTLGGTEVWEKDNRLFNTRVTSQISYDVRWAITPAAGKIAQVIGQFDNKAHAQAIHDLALTSLNR